MSHKVTTTTPVYISDFRKAQPTYTLPQGHILQWLKEAHLKFTDLSEKKTKFIQASIDRFSCSPEKISARSTFVEDFSHFDWERMKIYSFDNAAKCFDIESRMQAYETIVNREIPVVLDSDATPNHFIHVTCTGYLAPSPAQQYCSRHPSYKNTHMIHLYHMGCYASIPALNLAQRTLNAESSSTSSTRILHSELCSLHVDPRNHEPDQIVAQSLFSDGIISYQLTPTQNSNSLKLITVHEELLPETENHMSWNVTSSSMKMTLSKNVPDAIAKALPHFIRDLFQKANLEWNQKNSSIIYAIHPGGPKIIDQIQNQLELLDSQVEHSRNILYHYGNMSSATLPHIWDSILSDDKIQNRLIVSLAFGPGLTLCGALLVKP